MKRFPSSCDQSSESTCRSEEIRDRRRARELDLISGVAKAKTMPVSFGSLVRFLAEAIQEDCAWLEDFAEDTVQIDADLYEVLLSYKQLRDRRAA